MKGKHVLVTGHTGFKGSWLIAMLNQQGATVSGISLNPVKDGLFEKAKLHELLANDIRLDIRDSIELTKVFQRVLPDVVIHLAAQPLVLASYERSAETFETNVVGTLNVLKAVDTISTVQATLIVTTDKVYQQMPGVDNAFVETDPLGAADPYSTSKAMADLLTQSWISSHSDARIAIARAGNVVGGGDVAKDRLLPDLVKAFASGRKAIVRNPQSVRPWQHVLDCIAGYISLTEALVSGKAESGAYNFGPSPESPLRVGEVAEIAASIWGESARWVAEYRTQPYESTSLTLNSNKSQSVLGWNERLSSRDAINLSIEWSIRELSGESARALTLEQLRAFANIR